jgi:hypothetical protein
MRPRWLAVNAATGESDLDPLTPADQKEAFGDAGVLRLPYERLAGVFERRQEAMPIVILLVFAAFAAEAAMGAWRSSRAREARP